MSAIFRRTQKNQTFPQVMENYEVLFPKLLMMLIIKQLLKI